MTHSIEKLEEIIRRDGQRNISIHQPTTLVLKPNARNFTDEQMEAYFGRDFKSRLFITATNITSDTVFLRSKFSDNHPHASHLNPLRDLMKATHSTSNYTAAKTNCTELLSMCFQANESTSSSSMSKYYSFAVTVASALSNMGEGTGFEICPAMVMDEKKVELSRQKFCLLMHIIFSKMAMYRFLVNEDGSNTYRITHCRLKESGSKRPLIFAIFSFLLQFCLTGYVLAENISIGFDMDAYLVRNLPLAIMTLLYGFIIAYPGLTDREPAANFYGGWKNISLLMGMDFFVNQILAIVLVLSGFLVIMIQDSFIEAVLNTAALLFIPEIDDSLPGLLGFDEKSIIENFIIQQSLEQFERVISIKDQDLTKKLLSVGAGVDFSDYYLTNIGESPSHPETGSIFQPYQIRAGTSSKMGHQIDPSNFVTENCLIREIEWSYTHCPSYAKTVKPRIAYLRIVKMCKADKNNKNNKEDVVEIERKAASSEENIVISDVKHKLKGCFIITTFQMSNDIIRLRLCGSKSAEEFLHAFEYYSLWSITPSATRALKNEIHEEHRHNKNNNISVSEQSAGLQSPRVAGIGALIGDDDTVTHDYVNLSTVKNRIDQERTRLEKKRSSRGWQRKRTRSKETENDLQR